MAWSKLVDMELDDEDQLDMAMPIPMPERPRYPCGLKICLEDAQLKQLGLDADCEDGDMIDLRAFGIVTCVHKEDGRNRVEIQLQRMAVENEMDESEAENED